MPTVLSICDSINSRNLVTTTSRSGSCGTRLSIRIGLPLQVVTSPSFKIRKTLFHSLSLLEFLNRGVFFSLFPISPFLFHFLDLSLFFLFLKQCLRAFSWCVVKSLLLIMKNEAHMVLVICFDKIICSIIKSPLRNTALKDQV